MSKKLIPESRSKSYEAQKRMLEANVGFHMPQALEAIALNLMVFTFTNERLYVERPLILTRCVEMVDGIYPVVVGGFGSDGLHVNDDDYGVAALQKF